MARSATPRIPPPAAPEAAPAPAWVAGGQPIRTPSRSMGLKLLLVCALALVMAIPALFVFALLSDRTQRAGEVAEEIGGVLGGPQTFLGPVLAVPYNAPQIIPASDDGRTPARTTTVSGVWYIFPVTGAADVSTRSEVRRRALFKVPVYKSEVKFTGRFEIPAAGEVGPEGATLNWAGAELIVGASDPRGAMADVQLSLNGQATAAAPAALLPSLELRQSEESARPRRDLQRQNHMRLFGTAAGAAARPGAVFTAGGVLKFTGASRIGVLPFAKTSTIVIGGDWRSPSFDGGFLPIDRRIAGSADGAPQASDGGAARGFSARWSIPFVARGVPAQGDASSLANLGPGEVGVSFVEPANPYQSVSRSLKYAPMFLGLVFLAYFLFEITARKRVHPAQYILIGLAQIIFYLLLLSVAEHVGFDMGFMVAAGATVILISAYAGWVFESRAQGLRALGAFTVVYGLIYVLMRLEDYALLVGAVASFAAIALVMYFTRRIDWYGNTQPDTGNPA